MKDLLDEKLDLLGLPSLNLRSVGDFYLASHLISVEAETRSRADWAMDNLPVRGNIFLDEEDSMLLRDLLVAYVFANDSLVIIGSDAFLERLMTDHVETHGYKSVAKKGFGAVLRVAEEKRLLDPYILSRIRRLHAVRNNYAHEKGPDHEFRLFRRMLSERISTQEIAKRDAQEALCMSHGLAGMILRNFPRLDLIGTPTPYRYNFK